MRNHAKGAYGINPSDWIKKNEAIASFLFCIKATKKIFFDSYIKDSNSNGFERIGWGINGFLNTPLRYQDKLLE